MIDGGKDHLPDILIIKVFFQDFSTSIHSFFINWLFFIELFAHIDVLRTLSWKGENHFSGGFGEAKAFGRLINVCELLPKFLHRGCHYKPSVVKGRTGSLKGEGYLFQWYCWIVFYKFLQSVRIGVPTFN